MHKGKGLVRRIILILLCLAVLAAALAFGVSMYMVSVTESRVLLQEGDSPGEADCILVLGCGLRPDGSPTPMLSSRISRAAELYHAGWAGKLLLSGDNSRADYNEVAAMKEGILELGVPEEDIVQDFAGLSTYDSLYRARYIFGVKSVILVTQEYHLYRALYLAEALDLEAWGVPATPRNDAKQLVRDLREVLARDKDFFTAVLQPRARIMGDPIPFSS
ncbi:MAG: YdcF family protein [Ruminiclostridium sp.]|nr:YdcF family protein [Ruminiclostridium sp.]